MENPSLVHMIHGFDQLIHISPYPVLCHVVAAPAYELVDVHVHELKHKRKPACGLITARMMRKIQCCIRQMRSICSIAQQHIACIHASEALKLGVERSNFENLLEHLKKFDDVWVRRQPAQCLNLSKVVDLQEVCCW